jgi:hypothetical protein
MNRGLYFFLFYSTLLNVLLIPIVAQSQNKGLVSYLLYEKGKGEVRVFDNHYQEITPDVIQHLFNTIYGEVLYGISHHYNIGLKLKFRKVKKDIGLDWNDVFISAPKKNHPESYNRTGITAVQLVLRHAGFRTQSRWAWQHQVSIPLGNNLEGKEYIDWNGCSVHSQLFFSDQLGSVFLFSEIGMYGENISSENFQSGGNYFSYLGIPCSVLPGMYLSKRHFLYALIQLTPRWSFQSLANANISKHFTPYGNFGMGWKYSPFQFLEAECIVSRFHQWEPSIPAVTCNVGLRYLFD